MNTRLREAVTTAGITLLVTAAFALANGLEDRIVNGVKIGTDTADLIAHTEPCYCTETCR